MKNKVADIGKKFVILAAAVSALGGMLFGYDIGVISGAILFIKTDFFLPALRKSSSARSCWDRLSAL